MATGTISNFQVYNDFIHSSFVEQFTQNSDAFNEKSNGAIIMATEATVGDYKYQSFFEEGPDVERRDDTATSALTDNALTQDNEVDVLLARRRHQATTRSQWLNIGKTPEEFGRVYSAQLDVAIRREMLNRALAAVNAALSNVSALLADDSGQTMDTDSLAQGLTLFGDASDKIVLWVMHSAPYWNLVRSQITANIDGVSNFNIQTATPVTLNRPVLVTDSSSLVVSATGTRYITLGLTAGAIRCVMSQMPYTAIEEETGKDNIIIRQQTEYAYLLGLKGFKYDTANGGRNPNNTNVATAGNWDQAATDNKSLPGIRIRTQ